MLSIDNSLALQSSIRQPSSFNTEDAQKLKEQTDSFEALLLKEMLDISMKEGDAFFPKGTGSQIYKSMYNDTMSKELSGGFGYSKLLFEFLTKKQ